jgi:hypothetical protein
MGGQVDRNKDDKAKQGKKNRSRGKDDKAKQGKKNRSRGKDDKAKRGKKQAEHDKAKQAADKAKQGKKKHDKAKQAADKAKQAADDDDWRILLADYKAKQAKRTTMPRGPRAAGKPKLESQIKKIRSRGAAVVHTSKLAKNKIPENRTRVFLQCSRPNCPYTELCGSAENDTVLSFKEYYCSHCGSTLIVLSTYGPA